MSETTHPASASHQSPHRLFSRRRLVLALAIAAAAVTRPPRARAWSEEEGGAELARLWREGRRCAPDAERHRRLLAAARAELAATGMTAAEQGAFLAALDCPVCGGKLDG